LEAIRISMSIFALSGSPHRALPRPRLAAHASMMVFRLRGRISQTGVRCASMHNAGAISSTYGRANFSACVRR
jgi:hypothetical protein